MATDPPEKRALGLLLELKRQAYKSQDDSLQKVAPKIHKTYKRLRELVKN